MAHRIALKIDSTRQIVKKTAVTGTDTIKTQILKGGRLAVTLDVKSLDSGAKIVLDIVTKTTEDGTGSILRTLVLDNEFNFNPSGVVNMSVIDFHEIVDFVYDVTGGDATFTIGVTVADNAADRVQLLGSDLETVADVDTVDGKNRLQVETRLKAFDSTADTWLFIGTEGDSVGVGGAGDTVQIEIAAGDDATLFPAVDVTTTVQSGDDEDDLAARIVTDLNADADFMANFFARTVNKVAALVHISAVNQGPQGERPNAEDFKVTTTGTTVVTRAFDRIVRRDKRASIARDISDPTMGILEVITRGTDATNRFVEFFQNGGSSDMLVNGSPGSPIDFTIDADASEEKFIDAIRISSSGNGIKFGQFLSKAGGGGLANGLLVTIRSNNSEFTFPALQTTEDILDNFSLGTDNFDLFIQAGADQIRATLTFSTPFQLFKQGTFATDDFVRIRIQDNITSGISKLSGVAFGFKREF